jgi:hypothetical protein
MNANRTVKWALAAVLLLVLLVLVLGLMPVTYRVTAPGPDPLPLGQEWERLGQPEQTSIEVRASGPVAMRAPTLTWPEVYNEGLLMEAKGFQFDQAQAAFVSDGPGQLVFAGVHSDAAVTLLPGPGRHEVRFTRQPRGGPEVASVTVEPTDSEVRVELPSAAAQYARTVALAWAGTVEQPAGVPGMVVEVAGREVAGDGVVSVGALLGAALPALVAGLAVFGAATVLVVAGWLLGCVVDPRGPPTPARGVLRATAGVTAVLVAANGLSYIIPARAAALAMALTVVALLLIRLRLASVRVRVRESAGPTARLLPWVLVPAGVQFFPVLAWGGGYAGEYKTDLYEYATMASIVRDHSLIAMQDLPIAQASGTLTSGAGFAWRSIDSVGAAVVSAWTGIGTVSAITVLSVAAFLLFGLALMALSAQVSTRRVHRLVVAILLLNPLFVALFIEGYLSQYYFVALVPGFILATDQLISPTVAVEGADRSFLRWALAAIAAFQTAVYPYFFALVLAAAGLVALLRTTWRRAALRNAWPVAWRTLLLTNLALLTVLNYSETAVYQDSLNAIARNVLLGPFQGAELLALAAGFLPYQWRFWGEAGQPFMGQVGAWVWDAAGRAATAGIGDVIGLVLLVLGAVVLAIACRPWRSFATSAALATMAVWVAFGLRYVLLDEPYPALKGLWTAAALVPLLLATTAWSGRTGRLPIVGAVLLAVVAALWGRTILADRATWLITRDGSHSMWSHASIQPDLAQMRQALQGADRIALVRGPQPLAGSDRDRVGLAMTQVIARDLGVACSGCDGVAVPDKVECAAAPQRVVVVGAARRSDYCGLPLMLSTRVIEVYGE